MEWPDQLEVVVDVPRFGFIKRTDAGAVDFISPVPCPFNYGSVPGTVSGDGDRLDAVVLGPRLARGARARLPVVACVSFTDAGDADPKWVCAPGGTLSTTDRLRVAAFFRLYAHAKRVLHGLRRRPGRTRYGGLSVRP